MSINPLGDALGKGFEAFGKWRERKHDLKIATAHRMAGDWKDEMAFLVIVVPPLMYILPESFIIWGVEFFPHLAVDRMVAYYDRLPENMQSMYQWALTIALSGSVGNKAIKLLKKNRD